MPTKHTSWHILQERSLVLEIRKRETFSNTRISCKRKETLNGGSRLIRKRDKGRILNSEKIQATGSEANLCSP